MDVARLNFAHGDRAQHQAVLARIRRLAEQLATPVAVVQDLTGPKVRIGVVAGGSISLEAGQPLVLTTDPVEGSTSRVSVSYANLPREVEAGDELLLADGTIALRVERVTEREIHCRVLVGRRLSSRKGITVPSGLYGLPILGETDLRDLRFGLEQGVDYVGLSFVRSVEDVRTARAHIEALGGQMPVIAKIETQAALDRFDAIADAADGIMIARGDLSLETPFTRVPIVQKQLIAKANRRAKPVITATQMLYSMVASPQPTRAEVADVANAILDGSDAVMLSEETAVGQHPVRAVEVMAAIARETEIGVLPEAPRSSATELPLTGEDAGAAPPSRFSLSPAIREPIDGWPLFGAWCRSCFRRQSKMPPSPSRRYGTSSTSADGKARMPCSSWLIGCGERPCERQIGHRMTP